MGTAGASLKHLVAAEIRAEMARQRRTTSDLASHLQVSPTSASRRLSGDQGFDLDEVAVIASWLGVPIAQLIPAAGERVPA